MEGRKVEIVSVYIQENSWIAAIAARNLRSSTCALVIRNTVYLHGMTRHEFISNPSLLRHEVEHIRQWKREGFFFFLAKYLWHSFRVGYYHNPFEVEARDSESDLGFLHQIRIH